MNDTINEASDSEWQRATTYDSKWQQVITNDRKWQQMTTSVISVKFFFSINMALVWVSLKQKSHFTGLLPRGCGEG